MTSMMTLPDLLPMATLIDANWLDYSLVGVYFAFVLGIGVLARRQVSDSIDFFLSGRSLPAWVTGLAFISANLGAVEIMGMSASGAEFGMPNCAPLADIPMISTAPRLAEMNARPVTQAGSERPDRKKSMLLETERRARSPMPRTKTK